MAATESMMVLQSSALVAPVTALEFIGDDCLLTGEGPILSIFRLEAAPTQRASLSVLHNYRIHGMRPKLQKNDVSEIEEVAIFGGKALRLLNIRPSALSLQVAGPLLELQDWVLDVSWLTGETESLLGVCLAHNSVLLLEPQSGIIISLCSCVEMCLLYSALLIGPNWETSVLVGGTVFNQLVLWRPGGSKGDSQSQVERRLLGHSGVIFSLCYLQSARWLASASDDRSVRVWNVGVLGADGGCGVESPTCLRVFYGHQARVFCVRLSPGCVFSAGEDGACLLWEWEGNGRVGQTLKGHRSGGIRSLAVSRGGGWVATGGADGGIRAWRVLEGTSLVDQSKEGDCQIDLGFSGRGCPKVVRSLGGRDAVLVCTDQGEVLLHQDESWQTVWNGGPEFQSYCVMDVAPVQFQDASLWVCAVGNLNSGVQVFALHHPNSGVLLQAGQGKVHALQWVQGDRLCLLASGAEGLVYRWTLEVIEDKTGLGLRLEKQKSFLLPPCAKRWLTAAVRLPRGNGSLWVCGDRRGSLLLYREGELCEESEVDRENREGGSKEEQGVWEDENRWPESTVNDIAAPISPVNTLFGVHGKQGVTSVCEHQGLFYSTGRDGCVRVLTVDRNTLKVRRVHRASKGMEWLEKVMFLGSEISDMYEVIERRKQDGEEEERSITDSGLEIEGVGQKERDAFNEEAELKKTLGVNLEDSGSERFAEARFVMVGFHSIQFVLWDPLTRDKLFSVTCGGGHRSWAYIFPSHTQTLPSSHSLREGMLIFIQKGAVMSSRSLTSKATHVRGHTLKDGLHGRGLSCICHLGSVSRGGLSSEEWEVLVTGGEDTTVSVLAIEPWQGTVKVLAVLADHISNVRTLAAVQREPRQKGGSNSRTNTSSLSTFLFSAGGRAQLQCYQLLIGWDEHVNWPVCQVTQVAGHRLDEQWERRRNRHKTVKMDPETRYMSMAVVHESIEEILVTLACSDGAVRLFTVREESRKVELVWENFYHQRCVLSVASYSFEDPQGKQHVLLFSGATDGAVALWDLTTVLDSKSTDSWHGPSAPCFSLPVHQSGVNALVISNEVEPIDKDIITVASGGDDGQLSLMKIRMQLRQEVVFPELLSHWTVPLAHSAPLTALGALDCATLVSTSPDQRVCVWRVCHDGLQNKATVFSHTADAAGLWVWHKKGSGLQSRDYVVVCGQGLQVLELTNGKDPERKEKE
ncbi:WD repeat-containing protein 6 [Silurus asotus]|uniref:tRNA (34-2'-O)-methyltransferase regulator WDR6 n=1 Tax=Silurus asotus TaxID=30991 RepID=A0AAD5A6S6_SILAS|nr:WD repeat-containing protein 6 [Silurus asotus]